METPTGKEISYLYICRRKLWLFHHGIRPELEYGSVKIGMNIGERSFRREKKEISLGEVGVLDWADFADGVIHETKKGIFSIADLAQVRYYLKVLRGNGVDVRTAIIHYPTLRKQVNIVWDEHMDAMVRHDMEEVKNVIHQEVPEAAHRRTICKHCAYEETCFA